MSFAQTALRRAHYPTLDGVRGLAILMVVLHNFSFDDANLSGPMGRLLHLGIGGGWIGVTLFFVLSGFLITGILLDTQHEPGHFRRFYLRRTLRIAPLYYAVLLVTFVVLPLVGAAPESVRADAPQQLWLWTYLSNWVQPFGMAGHSFPHFWSLAVEEQFYLLWPLLTWRRSPRAVLYWGLALAVVSLLVRAGLLLGGGTPDMAYVWSPCRMDALALGGSVAAALRMPRLASRLMARRRQLLVAAVAVFTLCVLAIHGLQRTTFAMQTLGYCLLAISFSLLVLALACADLAGDVQLGPGLWRAAPLRVLARYSYGIYIIHKPLQQGIGTPLMQSFGARVQQSTAANATYFVVGLAASLALAALSYHLFEQRFLALKAHVR
jgi:peptidoglycan/LPS O-acetylase OafA/YrhL